MINYVKDNILKFVTGAGILNGFTFVGQILEYMRDGVFDPTELHTLLIGSSGVELVMIAVLYIFISKKQV